VSAVRRVAASVAVAAVLAAGITGLLTSAPVESVDGPSAPVSESIPRCHHDDYNDGSQDRCFTVNVQTGQILVIDSSDEVIS